MTGVMSRVSTRSVAGAVGAALTLVARRAFAARPPGGHDAWRRSNHAGADVSLLGGLALGAAVTAVGPLVAAGSPSPAHAPRAPAPGVPGSHATGLALAPALAAVLATVAGALDDHGERLTGVPTAQAKGLRGHLGALARGEVTTGSLKIAVIGAGAFVSALALPGPRGPIARLADTTLIAGCANLANLFDLRPGRALKVGALVLAPVALLGAGARGRLAAGTLGAVAATLPADLAARDMLGDTGANPLGAVVGVVLAADRSVLRRTAALGAVVALTLASERVSFSGVIDSVPALRALDRAGRAP